MTSPRFIVAEISKNWTANEIYEPPPPADPLIANLFENLINVNAARGYRLSSWQLHRILTDNGHSLNETIVAVFEWDDSSPLVAVPKDPP